MIYNLPTLRQLAIALIASLIISLAARRARALSVSGAVAAAIVGFLVFGFGGVPGAVSLILFFFTSTALSRLGKSRKAALSFEKGGERDAGQVLANGGVAALCAALMPFFADPVWLIAAFLAALAEANADTWATEIGSLSGKIPRLITTMKPTPTGSSGAISLLGTGAALCGAIFIAIMASFWGLHPQVCIAVISAGFSGALFDSFLGATVQAQYRCVECRKLTEKRVHCGDVQSELERGFRWLGNDLVNGISTLFAAIVAASIYSIWH